MTTDISHFVLHLRDSLQKERRRFAHICPDFVIELKSPMEERIANGVRPGWLIDPDHRVHTAIWDPDAE